MPTSRSDSVSHMVKGHCFDISCFVIFLSGDKNQGSSDDLAGV